MQIREACDGSRSTRTLDLRSENTWSKAGHGRRNCWISPERMRLPASGDLGGEGIAESYWPLSIPVRREWVRSAPF